jgi:hypothetical protein
MIKSSSLEKRRTSSRSRGRVKEHISAGQASASAAPSAMAFAYFAVPPVGLKDKL